ADGDGTRSLALGDGPDDDVPIRDHADEVPVVDDRQRPDVFLLHQAGCLLQRLRPARRAHRAGHRVTNALSHLLHLRGGGRTLPYPTLRSGKLRGATIGAWPVAT